MRRQHRQSYSMLKYFNRCYNNFFASTNAIKPSFLKTSQTAMSYYSTLCLVKLMLYILEQMTYFDTPPATGGSAIKAVEVLLSHGVPENRIIFINLVCILSSQPLI